jgi:hypothetical protein
MGFRVITKTQVVYSSHAWASIAIGDDVGWGEKDIRWISSQFIGKPKMSPKPWKWNVNKLKMVRLGK